VVDSKPSSVTFYEHAGFLLMDGQDQKSDTLMMFFDLARTLKTEIPEKIEVSISPA
jgi:hypothetical protein